MKRCIYLFFLTVFIAVAQEKTPPNNWNNETKVKLLLTQTAFSNWNAGGDTSLSGILSFHWKSFYQKNKLFWNNTFNVVYGANYRLVIIDKKAGEKQWDFQKTDDVLNFESKFSYRKNELSKWYYSARLAFNTQMDDGYKYKNKERAIISRFFAPAYIFLGIGADFNNVDKNFKVHLSPITKKTTFVFDDDLSKAGAFGVTKGENIRVELGVLATFFLKKRLMKNIEMTNKLTMYSDYINNYGTLDLNWDCHIKMTVNKYIESTLSLFILFDEDIKDKISKQAELQVKQILGIGFTYII